MANRNGNYLGPQSYNNVTQPQQQNAVYNNGTPHRGCVTKAFMVTGILHAVAGGLCVVLGIAAIVLKAFQSYVATPIWAGLFFFIATGVIGIVYYYKPKNMCIVISYMVMTIVSAVLAGIMWIMYISFDMYEYEYGGCIPLDWTPCNSPVGVRILVDSLVIVVTFLEMVCAIVAATVTCFKTCKCCRQCSSPCCSDGPPSNTMIYYAANSGTGTPMMTVPVDQHNRPIYIAGQTGGAFPSGTIMIMAPGPQAQPALVHAQGQPASQAQMQPIPQAQGQTVPQTQAQVQGQPGSYVQTVPQGLQVQPTGQQFQTQGNAALPAQGSVIQAPSQVQMIPTSVFYPPLVVGQGTPQPLPQGQQQQQPQQQQQQQQQPNQFQQQGQQQQQKGAEVGEHPSDPTEDEMTEVAVEPNEHEVSGHTMSGQFSDQSALI